MIDAWIADLEAQPVFIASQLRAGAVLSESDVAAIQSVLSELDNRENNDIETWHAGRIAGFHEIGGQELVDAIAREESEWISAQVRKTMDKMDEARGEPPLADRLRAALERVGTAGSRAAARKIAREALAREYGE